MSVLYTFRRDDGMRVDRWFPMGECPAEIVCEDGGRAVRVYEYSGVLWKGGRLPPDEAAKLNADMRRRNEEAGKRMGERWTSVRE